MKMDLGKIFDLEGESLVVEDVVDLSSVKLSSGIKPFAQPVPVKAVAQNRAGVVTLSLSVSFTLRVPCDRCLEVFEQSYSLTPEHTVVPVTTKIFLKSRLTISGTSSTLEPLPK